MNYHQKNSYLLITSLFLTLAFLMLSGFVNATVYYVATNGSNTAPYDTWAKASTTIQTAISAASNGDIIFVGSSNGHGTGIYIENIVVNRSLTIQSENGYSTTTVEAARPDAPVFKVQSVNVTIEGFSIYGATNLWMSGIELKLADGSTINNNRCGWDSTHNNSAGISINKTNTCTISNTIASYNLGQGISIDSSNQNTFFANVVNYNTADGIGLTSSYGNNFNGNTVNNNGFDGFAITVSNDNTFKNNTASQNGNHGFQFFSCEENNLIGNTSNNNLGLGFYLMLGLNNTLDSNTANYNISDGVGLDNSSNNKLNFNTLTHNEYGIFIFGSVGNIINSDTLNNNDGRPDGDGIMIDSSFYTTIENCTMNNDPGDGIEFFEASNNYVFRNTVINSGWGIRINYYSANNVLSNNIANNGVNGIILEEDHSVNNVLANNTTNDNSENGIFIYNNSANNILIGNTANNNTINGIHINASNKGNSIYFNNLSGNNEKNVFVEDTNNTWHSPVAINYSFQHDTLYKGYLGNYYGDGNHTGIHGIGGTYMLNTGIEDNYQLIDTTGSYSFQAWWLNSDGKMYRGDVGRSGDSIVINGGADYLWRADYATWESIYFSDKDGWTGQLSFTLAPASGHVFNVEVGYIDGENFIAGGPKATLIGDDSTKNFIFETDTSAFTLSSGNYLALKISSNDAKYSICTGGAYSFISSPANSSSYVLSIDNLATSQIQYSLMQNFPNPFRSTTKIKFTLPKAGHVVIKVYDLSGRIMATLLNKYQSSGLHTIEFNAENLNSGIYFYRMTSGKYSETRKMMLQ